MIVLVDNHDSFTDNLAHLPQPPRPHRGVRFHPQSVATEYVAGVLGHDPLAALRASAEPFWSYFARHLGVDLPAGAADLRFGNPTELAPTTYVDTLLRWTVPRSPDWFAYPGSLRSARAHVAALCRDELGADVDDDGVHLTNGAFGALALALHALVHDEADEVVVLDPPWFFYDLQGIVAGARCVHVALAPPRFSPSPAALAEAITARTVAVILNSPHNPTGRVYTTAELAGVVEVLRAASARIGRPIRLLSDESYRRIVFDGRTAPSPAALYEDTVVIHTYGKTTLAPGERIGWLAVPRGFTSAAAFHEAVLLYQVALGWAFPDAVLQRALPELEGVRIDVAALQRRRDRLVAAAAEAGYDVIEPEGTFYVLVRVPDGDDEVFCARLAERDAVFVLPGAVFRLPGWLRVSLTASDAMVERAVRALRRAADEDAGRTGSASLRP